MDHILMACENTKTGTLEISPSNAVDAQIKKYS